MKGLHSISFEMAPTLTGRRERGRMRHTQAARRSNNQLQSQPRRSNRLLNNQVQNQDQIQPRRSVRLQAQNQLQNNDNDNEDDFGRDVLSENFKIALNLIPTYFVSFDIGQMDLKCSKCGAFNWNLEKTGGCIYVYNVL